MTLSTMLADAIEANDKALVRLRDAAKRLAEAPHLTDLRMEVRIVANAATDYTETLTVLRAVQLAASVAAEERS